MGRNMRVDARQNRALLLDAAAAAFEIEGFDTPLESVAKRAGVSRTTLYRNFPDREALGFAIFERSILELEELSRAVCDRADGFFVLLETILDRCVESAGLTDALERQTTAATQMTELRHRVLDLIVPSLEKAQGSKLVDSGLDRVDVDIILQMLRSSLNQAPLDDRRDRATRAFAIIRAGLAPRASCGPE